MQTEGTVDILQESEPNNAVVDSTTKEIQESVNEMEPRDLKDSDNERGKVLKQIIPYETEALRLKQKCKDLKQKIADLEAQNQVRAIGVSRVKDSISRSRFEYSLLLELLEKRSSTLPIPDLKNLNAKDFDVKSVESLKTEDITNLLSSTPLEMLDVKKLFPNTLGDLLLERQKQFVKSKQAAIEDRGKTHRRKRGALNTVSGSSRKRVRDPREPKRPTNAYLFFCDSERERVKAEWAENHPNEHIDLSKAMTDVWKTMSDEDKRPYFEKYEKDRARYQKAVEEFEIIKEKERLAAAESSVHSENSASASVEPDDETPVMPLSDTSVDATFDDAANINELKSEDLADDDDNDHLKDMPMQRHTDEEEDEDGEEDVDKRESVLEDESSIQGDLDSEDPNINSELQEDAYEVDEDDILNDAIDNASAKTVTDPETASTELKSEPDFENEV
ncbi:hypothetical protein CANINC_002189 [Pichia inconspicua]|uniref:HMG box domain-containing protein n=1 Tax=Pichia inconspicua TaxID=52247 RepID=A0A4T0X1P8_9ASCO|nr:hypothetical protein CANINC_002189 [[Candida] inconspicua]